MLHRPARRLWPAALVLLSSSLAGAADPSPPQRPARADPLDPAAAVPATPYHSVFKQYRALRDEPLRSWKEANDEVARIGGWRVYAREAAQPDAAAPPRTAAPASAPSAIPAPTPASVPTPPGPAGHRHQ